MSVDNTVEIAADHQRIGEVGHALDEADQEGVGEAGADQRPGDGAERVPRTCPQGLRRFLEARSDSLQHAEQHQHRDRRERQHLRDGDARHAIDPAAARDVEQVADPNGDHAGAAEQQDQREADDEGWRDDRQNGQHPEQRLHPHARAQCHQREGEPEQRGQHADQRRLRHGVPCHAAASPAGDAVEAPDRRAEQFLREQHGREAAIVVADRGGQDAEHRIEHEQRDQSHHQQDRADHEHVALAHAQPREAIGQQHEAGERVEGGAPAHGRLHRTAAQQRGEPGVGPAAMDDQQPLGGEPHQAGGTGGDQRARSCAAERGPEAQQQRQCERPQPGCSREQRRWRDAVIQAVPRKDQQRRETGGEPEGEKAWRLLHRHGAGGGKRRSSRGARKGTRKSGRKGTKKGAMRILPLPLREGVGGRGTRCDRAPSPNPLPQGEGEDFVAAPVFRFLPGFRF